MEYSYPIDLEWTNEEMMQVVAFFNAIEKYYESKVEGKVLLEAFNQFKKIVPGKAEEKQIFKEFEKQSGYNSYKVVKLVKDASNQKYFSSKQI